MSKEIKYDLEAREHLKNGVDKLANAVKVTLGAAGRNVVIGKKYGAPQVTKDGVTVAKEIELKHPIENMGAQMVKEVASKTATDAGDGTTTATVLAQAIITAGLKNVAAGANPMELKQGIDLAVKAVVGELKAMSRMIGTDTDKIRQIATISANNDLEIGALISTAVERVTKDGVITVEEARGTETSMDLVEGMQFDRGYASQHMVTDSEKMIVEYNDVYILMLDSKLDNMKEFLPLLEQLGKSGRPFLIIADDITEDILSILLVNKIRNGLKVVGVKSPGFGERRKDTLEDLAILTGGKVISAKMGLKIETTTLDMLGEAKKITIDSSTTTILGGFGSKDDLDERIKHIKGRIAAADSEYDKEKLQERLAKLAGGIAVLHIGATTEAEMKEKKDRVDDALAATRAAIEEGIVPGGGVALIRASKVFDELLLNTFIPDVRTGIDIIKRAIEEPLRQMVKNAGEEGAVIVQKVREGEGDFGYNVRTGKFVDMFKEGIIDPTKVTRVALENAASIAALLLTTECVIVDEEQDNAAVAHMNHDMM